MSWSSIPKMRGNSKTNQHIKRDLYNCIIQHTQVYQSTIANDRLKLSIDGQVETQLVPKLSFQVSVRELHNRMVSTPEEGRLKEVR